MSSEFQAVQLAGPFRMDSCEDFLDLISAVLRQKGCAQFVSAFWDCFGAENRAGTARIIEIIGLHPPWGRGRCMACYQGLDTTSANTDSASEAVCKIC